MIRYALNETVTVDQFIGVLEASGLGERRPIHDRDCLASMLEHGNLTITAWDADKLVGIARSVTDFSYCCYLSDLAVDRRYQQDGIGLELQRQTQARIGEHCKIILLSAPAALTYYPKIGYTKHDGAFLIGSDDKLGRS
ncbi:MAG: GNAT family N-acetyltransferase [Pseudomonadota bacterium]